MMTIGLVLVWLIVATVAALAFGWLCGLSGEARELDHKQLEDDSPARA